MQIWNSRAHAGVLHLLIILGPVAVVAVVPAMATATAGSITQVPAAAGVAAAPDCRVAGQSGAAVPKAASATGAVRTTMGVARAMHVPRKGQIVAVMVMFQESTIRNLANDGSSAQRSAWAPPGRAYWLRVSRLSLKYPHDLFGTRDGAHDTDSIGLYQQRPAWGWGNYGGSTGTSDPEGVVQRLLDPRWESMAFFGGPRSAAGNWGLLDVPGWEHMAATDAAEAVQGSTRGNLYAKWEPLATQLVKANSDTPAIALPWYPGGAAEALTCTGIPTDPALGEAGRNPWTHLDLVALQGTGIRVRGWAFDPDASNGAVAVHFRDAGPHGTFGYDDGLADRPRSDVNRAFNILGRYGFQTVLPWTGPGRHTICATAINIGRGTANPRIGCRDVLVPGPVGAVDRVTVTADGRIALGGWAADPQAPGLREQVHIYVTGPSGTRGTAGTYTGDARSDVARHYPWAGTSQGFHATVRAAGWGVNQVCGYAINVNLPHTNPRIGCRSLAVRAPSPLRSPGGPRTTGDQPAVSERTDRSSAPAVSSSPDSRPPKAPTATAPSP